MKPSAPANMTLSALAGRLGCRLTGDGDMEIRGVAGMEHAGPGELTFLANPKYAPKVKDTQASAILAREPVPGMATLVSANPYLDFARALALFYQPPRPAPGIHPLAFIDPSAEIGLGASIGPFVSVGANTRIGVNAVLHPHVTIYEGVTIGDDFVAHAHVSIREFCRLGNRVVLQNGVVIGGDGFGFAKDAEGRHQKIVQSGIVVIEDDVEIQSLTSIDRAAMGETRIRRGARIDSLVQIGHACDVGEDTILCGQVGLAGSTVLKNNVLLAGQVGVAGHLTIHEGAILYAQSGVGHDVPAGSVIAGSPAFDAREWRRAVTAFPKLGDLLKQMRQLERRVSELEAAPGEPAA
jgi:UDP-3-O-[3-hydroxymyristoyl] glucosamine N-acyltransferase